MPLLRAGVVMPPLKARIFDAVKRAGPDGIGWHDLFCLIYSDSPSGVRPRWRLKSHMPQINEMLEGTGYRIHGCGGAYVLRKHGGLVQRD